MHTKHFSLAYTIIYRQYCQYQLFVVYTHFLVINNYIFTFFAVHGKPCTAFFCGKEQACTYKMQHNYNYVAEHFNRFFCMA